MSERQPQPEPIKSPLTPTTPGNPGTASAALRGSGFGKFIVLGLAILVVFILFRELRHRSSGSSPAQTLVPHHPEDLKKMTELEATVASLEAQMTILRGSLADRDNTLGRVKAILSTQDSR